LRTEATHPEVDDAGIRQIAEVVAANGRGAMRVVERMDRRDCVAVLVPGGRAEAREAVEGKRAGRRTRTL
jgi:hypothetical protein